MHFGICPVHRMIILFSLPRPREFREFIGKHMRPTWLSRLCAVKTAILQAAVLTCTRGQAD